MSCPTSNCQQQEKRCNRFTVVITEIPVQIRPAAVSLHVGHIHPKASSSYCIVLSIRFRERLLQVNWYLLGSLLFCQGFWAPEAIFAVVNTLIKGSMRPVIGLVTRSFSLIMPLIYKWGPICQSEGQKRLAFSSWSHCLVVNELFICASVAAPPSLLYLHYNYKYWAGRSWIWRLPEWKQHSEK